MHHFLSATHKSSVSPVSLLHFPFRKISKEHHQWGKISKHQKKVQTHTHTHTSKMKKTMFLCFFLHVCCEVFFLKKKCTHPSIVSSFFVKVTFLQLERIQATGSTANMPLWILQAPPWAESVIDHRCFTGSASCNHRWTATRWLKVGAGMMWKRNHQCWFLTFLECCWMYGRFLMCSILVDWKYWKNGCGGPFLTFRRRWQRLASQLFASLGSSGAFLVAHFLCASLCTVRAISYVVGSMNGWYMKLYATHQQTASPKKQRVRQWLLLKFGSLFS